MKFERSHFLSNIAIFFPIQSFHTGPYLIVINMRGQTPILIRSCIFESSHDLLH